MSKILSSPGLVFSYGTAVSLLVVLATFVFLSSEQCPDNYTQAQVNASDCVVGANIGFGLGIGLAFSVWVLIILVSILSALRKK